MKSTWWIPGYRPLMAIGYNYNCWKVIGDIATKRAGFTDTGDTNLSSFPDTYYNVYVLPVVYPFILVRNFNTWNKIYHHDKTWKYDPMLEKYGMPQNGYFIH